MKKKKLILISFLFVCLFSKFIYADEFYVHHIAGDGWRTELQIFNISEETQPVDIEIRDSNSERIITLSKQIESLKSIEIFLNDFVNDGSSRVISYDNNVVKVTLAYRFVKTHSYSETIVSETRKSNVWFIPNSDYEQYDWAGIAITNYFGEKIDIEITAVKDESIVGNDVFRINPNEKFAETLEKVLGLKNVEFDFIKVNCSKRMPSPFFITGNNWMERISIINPLEYSDEDNIREIIYRGAHIGTPDWTTIVTVYNPKDFPGESNILVYRPDGSVDGEAIYLNAYQKYCIDLGAKYENGIFQIEARDNIKATVSYKRKEDFLKCGEILNNMLGKSWFIPVKDQQMAKWQGVSISNFWNYPVSVSLKAVKNGSVIGQKEITINEHSNYKNLIVDIFIMNIEENNVFYCDYLQIESSEFISAPVYICEYNDSEGSAALFFERILNNLEFSDANFEYFLIENYDLNGDQKINDFEAANIEYINCSYLGIQDLSGIENFVNLETLICSGNKITNLDLTGLKSLKYLYCDSSEIETLQLDSESSLQSLSCSNNLLYQLDLSYLKKLLRLDCSNNYLCDLSFSNVPELYEVNCSGNKFTNIPDFTKCEYLQFIYCQDNYFGKDDCSMINDIENNMNLLDFVYNPQKNGENLSCHLPI